MRNQTSQTIEQEIELLGDWHPLLEQLGSAEGLATLRALARTLCLPRVQSLPHLQDFLRAYRDEILVPLELPVIHRACTHAARHEFRELLDLDQAAGKSPLLQDFAAASIRVGRAGLRRLRPLRDERQVQRYLKAVDSGSANGWHTIVYGMTLAVYSWPVRQGLIHYAGNVLLGFLHPVARPLQLSETAARSLVAQLSTQIPAAVENLLAGTDPLRSARVLRQK